MTATQPNWQVEDFRGADPLSLRTSIEKLCATARVVGCLRGIILAGALDDLPGTKQAAERLLAEYEAAQ